MIITFYYKYTYIFTRANRTNLLVINNLNYCWPNLELDSKFGQQ